jgi:hypothetical protein
MILAACILYGLIFRATPAEATLVTIEIEAAVDGVSDEANYLEGKIKVADIITGFYAYDSSVTRLPGERYEFDSPPCGVFLSAGGFDFKTDPSSVDFEMGIGNDRPWGDTYFFISFSNLGLLNGTPVDYISWQLDDPTGNALSSDALPTAAPVSDEWQSNILRFGADRRYGIFAHVTSAVPEPATIMLVGIGALFLTKRR